MADDHTQRPYRSNEPPPRGSSTAANSGTDPLAELARLIGQSDPFGEFGRDKVQRAPAATAVETPARPAAPAANYGVNDYSHASMVPAPQPPAPETPPYGAPNAALQTYANPPYAHGADPYHAEGEVPGYSRATVGGYAHDQTHPDDEDAYDDAVPARRRVGIVAIAAVFALAVIGTAGAFGYRALFGSSGATQPPPVIKADTSPSKIMPAVASKTPNKLIYDRVNDRPQGEKLVSREEQPIDMKDRPANAAVPSPAQANSEPASAPPPLGSGAIASEPKKIHTIAIRPDELGAPQPQPVGAPVAAASPAPSAAPAQTRAVATPAKPAPLPPVRVASDTPAETTPPPAAPQRQPEARVAEPPRRAVAAAPSNANAPLSLSPDASAATPSRSSRAPVRTAAVAASAPVAAATSGKGGGYAVQVSAQRSEAEAQAAFRGLQAKYPTQLGGRELMIHKVELGAKGTYYRAMVGPFATAGDATALCSGLKAAGGQCIVQRN